MTILIADREASERMFIEELLKGAPLPIQTSTAFSMDEETLVDCVKDAEILVVGLAAVTSRVIERAKRLKLICKAGIGTDNIDLAAATARGIPVTRTSGVNTQGVAEYTIGAMIALLRYVLPADQLVRQGEWSTLRRRWSGQMGELRGKTLGLIGYGAIGRNVAELAIALRMRVLVCDPYITEADLPAEIELRMLESLLSEADFVSIHAVLTDETHHLIDHHALSLMRSSAFLINTARGPIVDEAALVAALQRGVIAGAALDVYENEPPRADHPFFAMDNVIVTPHIAGCTREGYHEIGAIVTEQIVQFLSGNGIDPTYVVNPSVLPSNKLGA